MTSSSMQMGRDGPTMGDGAQGTTLNLPPRGGSNRKLHENLRAPCVPPLTIHNTQRRFLNLHFFLSSDLFFFLEGRGAAFPPPKRVVSGVGAGVPAAPPIGNVPRHTAR